MTTFIVNSDHTIPEISYIISGRMAIPTMKVEDFHSKPPCLSSDTTMNERGLL